MFIKKQIFKSVEKIKILIINSRKVAFKKFKMTMKDKFQILASIRKKIKIKSHWTSNDKI